MDGKIKQFRYTYTRHAPEGDLVEHETGSTTGYTAKSVKHTLVKRFHFHAANAWTCLPNGTYQRSQRCPRTDDRSTLSITPIRD